jgi:hypothetical protein
VGERSTLPSGDPPGEIHLARTRTDEPGDVSDRPIVSTDPHEPADAADAADPAEAVLPADADADVDADSAATRRDARGTYDRVVVALLCLVGVQMGQRALSDNSFLTHLATGRIILDDRRVPTSDPYSFTAHGDPWTVQSWLASVIYASLERAGGLVSIRLLIVVLTVALLLLVWRLTAPAETLLARLPLVAGVVVVGATYWSERPLMFGLVGLALVLLAADDGFHPAWLLPIMWVWVNTHGSFPFAPAVLVLLALGRRLDGDVPRVELRALAWCVGGVLLGALNPLGPKLLVFPLGVLDKREAFTAVVEWQAPGWDLWSQRVFAVMAVLGLAAALFRVRRWRSVLPIVVFAAAGATSMRNLTQASIVIAAATAPALVGLGRTKAADRRSINRPAALAFGVMAVVLLVVGLSGPDTDLESYPTRSAAWLEDEDALGPSSRVLAPDVVGNFLEARFGPDDVQVFMDDRVDMFPMSVIDTYVSLRDADRIDEFPAIVEGIDPTVILWEEDSPLGRWLRAGPEGWTIVHEADGWLVATPS